MANPSASLREHLRTKESLLATFQLLPRAEVLEMLALAGFDAVVIDMEHGPIDVRDLPGLCAVAQGAGLFAIVRVRDSRDATIGAVLDTGPDGLLVPHVSLVDDARRVVGSSRFPPEGTRSINPYVRGNRFGADGAKRYEEVNERVAVIVMVEGVEAIEGLEAITGTNGLDAVFVGPVDLSASLGLAGQPEHPDVLAALRSAIVRIQAAGLASGIYAPTPAAASRWLSAGVDLVALSADSAMAYGAFSQTQAAAREGVVVRNRIGAAHDGNER